MSSYAIDFPEIVYYSVPIVLHVVISLLALRCRSRTRRIVFFITNLLAILGVAGVSIFVELDVNHLERFSEIMIVLSGLLSFNLYFVYRKLNKRE